MITLTTVGLFAGMPGISHNELCVDQYGVVEDQKHYGSTRIVNARSRVGYPKPPVGSIEANWRMFSAITLEDLAVIQSHYEGRYGTQFGMIQPNWLGPNIVFSGMEGFSKIPDGTLILFNDGPVLRVTSENKSCSTPGKLIANQLGLPIAEAKTFVTDADGLRGVVGTVDTGGVITIGMIAFLQFPD